MQNRPGFADQSPLSKPTGISVSNSGLRSNPLWMPATARSFPSRRWCAGRMGNLLLRSLPRCPNTIPPRFDEVCRSKAIYLASRLKNPKRLNLNLSAQSIFEIDLSIMTTFQASIQSGIPVENIIFEVLEMESLTDQRNLLQYLRLIQDFGFTTAIDDFGAGYSGLKLLAEYQPNYIKLDRFLIGNIQQDFVKQSVFYGVKHICDQLAIEIVAEGVESAAEYHWLNEAGISIFQGYYFARPAFEALPDVAYKAFST